jgi:hypothetical protein
MLCAICDNTNSTARLCAKHRADPSCAGWNEKPAKTEYWDNLYVEPSVRIGDTRAAQPTELEKRIVAAALTFVARDPRRDTHGRRRGVRIRYRFSYRELAAQVGCSHEMVRRVVLKLTSRH